MDSPMKSIQHSDSPQQGPNQLIEALEDDEA
jgi:hypothetical protein